MIKRISNYIKKHGGLLKSIHYFITMIKKHGIRNIFSSSKFKDENEAYQNWQKKYEQILSTEEIVSAINDFRLTPKFSILLPVYNVEEVYLRACLDSVLSQSYTNWELCIADDNSTIEHIKIVLREYMQNDERIKVIFREENGHISIATNSALEIASGEYIVLLDNDDIISKNALFEVASLINQHPEADMIYSDEDKLDASGNLRMAPFLKPDWSPDAFWGHMYISHLGVYRTDLAKEIGGMRSEYDGAQDYDFVLRFTEITKNIFHIPKILYHWRIIPTSTASGAGSKDYAYDAAIRAKEDAFKRRGYKAKIETVEDHRSMNVVFLPEESDFVSIIIPTKNHGDDIKKCVDSIYIKSTWKNFEIILVDNGSDEKESLNIFENYCNKYENFSILKDENPFNYSALNNKAAKQAAGNLVLFLNNDTEVITSDWLERMIGQAKLSYTGAVGAKLIYPNNTIQHAGIIIRNEEPVHAFLGFDRDALGYYGRLDLNYNYLAITGAALMIEKEKFFEIGMFDEEFIVAYNDVDLCLKLYDHGYYNVIRSDVQLYHYESKSRGYDETSEKMLRLEKERILLKDKWLQQYMIADPFYNINLTNSNIDFSLKD